MGQVCILLGGTRGSGWYSADTLKLLDLRPSSVASWWNNQHVFEKWVRLCSQVKEWRDRCSTASHRKNYSQTLRTVKPALINHYVCWNKLSKRLPSLSPDPKPLILCWIWTSNHGIRNVENIIWERYRKTETWRQRRRRNDKLTGRWILEKQLWGWR
jgi:hypothetical protein